MKKAKLVVILALSLVLGLALILVVVTYAQGPEGQRGEEGGGVGGLGLADPPPAGYTVLYMFTGARDNQNGADTAATSVHCTNYGNATVQVLVEISDFDNAPTISGTVQINPSWTATLSSQATAIYDEDFAMSTTDDINQGSGRIMANSSSAKIICTAQVVDPTTDPPEYGVKLTLFDSSGNLIGEMPKIYLPIILKSH